MAIGEREIQFEDKCLRVTASAGVAELMPGGLMPAALAQSDEPFSIGGGSLTEERRELVER